MVMCSVKDHSGRHSVDWYACLITPCHCVCLSVCAHTSKCHSSLVVNEGMSVSHWLKDLVSIRNGLLLLPTPNGCTQPKCVCVKMTEFANVPGCAPVWVCGRPSERDAEGERQSEVGLQTEKYMFCCSGVHRLKHGFAHKHSHTK